MQVRAGGSAASDFLQMTPWNPRVTFTEVLADKARRLGDKTFLTFLADGRAWTYAQFDLETSRIANGLLEAGVTAGSHVGLMMENAPEQLLAYFALAKLGAVTVPLNAAARGSLLAYFLAHANCTVLIVDAHLLPRVFELAPKLPLLKRVFEVSGAGGTPVAATPPAGVAVMDFALLSKRGSDTAPCAPRFCDLAFLMYTSGTTGPSKAIMFTQSHALFWGRDYALHHEYRADDIAYVYLPLFHGNAWLCTTLGALMADASIALAPRFSVSRFWSDVARSGATLTNLLGAVTDFLWKQAPDPYEKAHRLRQVGVSPVPSFGHEFEARFGVRIVSAYGLTDYCMAAAFRPSDPRDKLGSSGRARSGVEIRIVDEDDMPLPAGVPGEIVLRSDNAWGASIGYYKMPEESLASRRNLWFHTGDRGYLDPDGYLYFKDRIKDAIRRRGENISAFEVEQAIASHDAVESVAVYAVRADTREDEVAASIVLRSGFEITPAELIEHCRRNLAYFMVPRYIEFVDSLPMTLSQKVEKYVLRARAEAGLAAMWDRQAAGIALGR